MTTKRSSDGLGGVNPKRPPETVAAGEQVPMQPAPDGLQAERHLVWSWEKREYTKGNTSKSSGWLEGPAMFGGLVEATRRLFKAQQERGGAEGKVEHVQGAFDRAANDVFLFPCKAGDPGALPVTYNEGRFFVNLIDLLAPEGLTLASGRREKFLVEYVTGAKSPDGKPALKFNIKSPVDARIQKKKRGSAQPPSPSI